MTKNRHRILFRIIVTILYSIFPNENIFAEQEKIDPIILTARDIFFAHSFFQGIANAPVDVSRADFIKKLQSVDPYAKWISAAEAESVRRWVGTREREFGITLVPEKKDGDGRYLVLALQNGPAAKVLGSKAWELLSIADQQVGGWPISKITASIRTSAAVEGVISLTLARPETGRIQEVELHTGPYQAQTVERIDGFELPIYRIHRFEANVTVGELASKIALSVTDDQAVVIDLRYTVGGNLQEALNAASMFMEPGQDLGALRARNGRTRPYKAVRSTLPGLPPVVIFVGPGTASAAEVFVAAIKAAGEVPIIGQNTAGKCFAQSQFPLADGSILLITTEEIIYPGAAACEGPVKPSKLVKDDELHNTESLVRNNAMPSFQKFPIKNKKINKRKFSDVKNKIKKLKNEKESFYVCESRPFVSEVDAIDESRRLLAVGLLSPGSGWMYTVKLSDGTVGHYICVARLTSRKLAEERLTTLKGQYDKEFSIIE